MRWLWRELRVLAVPVLLYDAVVLLATIVFFGSLALVGSSDLSLLPVALPFVLCANTGLLIGQLFAILRLRSWVFWTSLALYTVAIFLLTPVLEPLFASMDAAGVGLILGMLIGTFLALGGYWSLRVNRELAAIWPPALLFVGSILILIESDVGLAPWLAGDKHAVWNVLTSGVLFLTVGSLLVYLAVRERYRLHRWAWASVERGGLGAPRPFRGCGSAILAVGLAVLLTIFTGLVAPYLWHTAPADSGRRSGESHRHEAKSEEKGDDPATGERLQRSVEQGIRFGCALLTTLVLAVAALLLLGRPLRRQLLLQHLRRPFWPVPPSRRALLHWRLAEIALGDAGVVRLPHETALDVAQRGIRTFPWLNLEDLEEAARIADRVAYGYALQPSDIDRMGRTAEMTYQALWENLSEWARLKATYRAL